MEWKNPNCHLSQFAAFCMLIYIRWSQGQRNSCLKWKARVILRARCDWSYFLPVFPASLSLSCCLLYTHIHLNTTLMFEKTSWHISRVAKNECSSMLQLQHYINGFIGSKLRSVESQEWLPLVEKWSGEPALCRHNHIQQLFFKTAYTGWCGFMG